MKTTALNNYNILVQNNITDHLARQESQRVGMPQLLAAVERFGQVQYFALEQEALPALPRVHFALDLLVLGRKFAQHALHQVVEAG